MISLMMLSGLLMAFVNRVRGGLFGDRIREYIPQYGTNGGRLVYSLGLSLLAALASGEPLLGLAVLPAAFLGQAIAPYSPFQSLTEPGHMYELTIRGVLVTGAVSVALGLFGFYAGGLLYLLSGLLMGVLYKAALSLPIIPLFNDDPRTRDRNDAAEVFFGFVQGAVIVLALTL